MYRRFLILFGATVLAVAAPGQGKNDAVPEIGLGTISRVNMGDSYISFPTDIGNIEPLWFEANLIPSFNIRVNKDSRLMGVLSPQIILRMYREESYPVRTPSYIPQITVFYKLISKNYAKSLSIFGKIGHHSNGQDGDFYLKDGEVNLKTGDFSTNFFELGVIKTNYNKRFNAVQFFGTSFVLHPPALSNTSLQGKYAFYRWKAMFSIFKLPVSDTQARKKASISLKGQLGWSFGEINDWKPYSLNRAILSFTFYYHPKFLEDIGFFAQVYQGMDYYNIYFIHQISVIRFGIMTEILNF